jgi:hypothetical protein
MHTENPYEDRTQDLIERIRRMRDAAQREMDKFGDSVGYDTRKIAGQKKMRDKLPKPAGEETDQ